MTSTYAKVKNGTLNPALTEWLPGMDLCLGRFNIQYHGDITTLEDGYNGGILCSNCGKYYRTKAQMDHSVAILSGYVGASELYEEQQENSL